MLRHPDPQFVDPKNSRSSACSSRYSLTPGFIGKRVSVPSTTAVTSSTSVAQVPRPPKYGWNATMLYPLNRTFPSVTPCSRSFASRGDPRPDGPAPPPNRPAPRAGSSGASTAQTAMIRSTACRRPIAPWASRDDRGRPRRARRTSASRRSSSARARRRTRRGTRSVPRGRSRGTPRAGRVAARTPGPARRPGRAPTTDSSRSAGRRRSPTRGELVLLAEQHHGVPVSACRTGTRACRSARGRVRPVRRARRTPRRRSLRR